MLFICYPKCSTCQKAKKWLVDHNIEFLERNIVTNNLTYLEIKNWSESNGIPLKKFFNTSGNLYKELHLKEKISTLSIDEQLNLLSSNGMLVKRPIIVDDNQVLIGFKEEIWKQFFDK